jgi:hypothetical protein
VTRGASASSGANYGCRGEGAAGNAWPHARATRRCAALRRGGRRREVRGSARGLRRGRRRRGLLPCVPCKKKTCLCLAQGRERRRRACELRGRREATRAPANQACACVLQFGVTSEEGQSFCVLAALSRGVEEEESCDSAT